MRKKTLLALFTALHLAVSCNTIPNARLSSPSVSPTVVSARSPMPSVTALATATLSATVMPTVAHRLMTLNQHCLDVSSTPVWDGTGALVLAPKLLRDSALINMQTGDGSSPVDDEYDPSSYFSQSPNRLWLAYKAINRAENNDVLVIQSADGLERFTYPIDYQEWNSIAYWLDDQTLVLWHYARPRTSIILFNPFTGQKTPMGFDYPEVVSDDWEWQMFWPSVTIYAPSLRYLVYLQETDGNILDPKMVLWNREAKQPIATIKDFGYALVYPLWKADESGLVYVKAEQGLEPKRKADEVYFLGIDGQNRQLTRLSDYFSEVKIGTYNWSSNERFLALNVNVRILAQEWERRLLVLDLANLELTDYCLKPMDFSPLIWLPDGQQLAFAEQLPDKQLRTVVIDLAKQRAFSVAEDSEPSAWLSIAE